MASRYYPQLDIDTFDKFNKELVGDPVNSKDGVINQEVVIYKVDVYETTTNIYGESSSGRTYKKGVKLNCIIDATPTASNCFSAHQFNSFSCHSATSSGVASLGPNTKSGCVG
mgnify:CR=1 FL=1